MTTSWTADEVRGEAERVRGQVTRHYADHPAEEHSVPTSMFLYACRNPDTGAAQKMLIYCPDIPIPDVGVHGGRDHVGAILKRLAKRCDASGIIFLTEAWTLEPPPDVAAKGEEASRKYLEAQAHGDWADHPDRKEIVQMHVEHRSIDCEFWLAHISRDSKGGGVLGDWARGASMRGRFSDFLGLREMS